MTVRKAIAFAEYHHKGQTRHEGNPHITHCFGVLKRAEKHGLDERAQMVAVLHDTLEDCSSVCMENLEEEFGKDVARMVYGLSKAAKHCFHRSKMGMIQRQNEYIKRLELISHEYPEVIILKICDQLDNLNTLHVFRKEKQDRIISTLVHLFVPMYLRAKNWMPNTLLETYEEVLNELQETLIPLKKRIEASNITRNWLPQIRRFQIASAAQLSTESTSW